MYKNYNVIGLMSGTSLDGLDIAYCEFEKQSDGWKYEIKFAQTIPYTSDTRNQLKAIPDLSGLELHKAHNWFANLCADEVIGFINHYQLQPHLIASHGHTIFHHPPEKYTLQIGNGAIIHARTQIPVVCDFRSVDVALNGQGAPLVPIGDKMLFATYDLCLNLGGIANISQMNEGQEKAFDVCPANIVLNHWVKKIDTRHDYDQGGNFAKSGKPLQAMLDELNIIEYYQMPYPKSMGREWIEKNVFPVVERYNAVSPEHILCTLTHHIAFQIAQVCKQLVNDKKHYSLLVTGGGAYNTFLIELLNIYLPPSIKVILPDKLTIEFKEALIFAFLGVLRIENQCNSLSSITGASVDSVGGALYGCIDHAIGI